LTSAVDRSRGRALGSPARRGRGVARRGIGRAAIAAAVFLGGCSSFEDEWEASVERWTASEAPGGLVGPWQGRWLSESTGHSGELRCIFKQGENGGHEASYRARWGWFFSFEYALPIEIESRPDGVVRFQSKADLGWPWGEYEQEGEATGARLRSSYRAESDHGTFELERPPRRGEEPGAP
jgi:hypothetical protein